MFTEKSAAKLILENTKRIYVESHCYKIIDPQDFSHLDLNFYENTMREIESQGFRHVADVENLTLKESLVDPRTFLRLGLSYDGTISSALYQIKPRIWIRLLCWLTNTKLSKVAEFETEFTDGSFVATSNARNAARLDTPPQIFSAFFPAETSAEVLLERHQARVEEHIFVKNVQPVQHFSLPDILESQHRMEKIKSEFRQRIGWLKKSEWDRLAKNPDQVSDDIYNEFKDLQEES